MLCYFAGVRFLPEQLAGLGKVRGEIGFVQFLGRQLPFFLLMCKELFPSMEEEHQCHTTNEFDEIPIIQKSLRRTRRKVYRLHLLRSRMWFNATLTSGVFSR